MTKKVRTVKEVMTCDVLPVAMFYILVISVNVATSAGDLLGDDHGFDLNSSLKIGDKIR